MIVVPKHFEPFMRIPFRVMGRGYDGCDCYGLSWLIKRDLYGIEAPTFSEDFNPADLDHIGALIGAQKGRWRKLQPDEAPQQGDDIVFRIKGVACHIGIFLGHKTFIHVVDPGLFRKHTAVGMTVAEEIGSMAWNPTKIEGFYRYPGLEGGHPA